MSFLAWKPPLSLTSAPLSGFNLAASFRKPSLIPHILLILGIPLIYVRDNFTLRDSLVGGNSYGNQQMQPETGQGERRKKREGGREEGKREGTYQYSNVTTQGV